MYDIYTGPIGYTVTPFSLSGGHCPDPTYTATDVTTTPVALPLSWLTFDDSTMIFTAESSDNGDVGTYTIEITASYPDGTTVSD